MKDFLLLLDRPRVELGARALVVLADVLGWAAGSTAAAAERYADTARWIENATRCVP